jgi:hypothetical protein
MTEVLRSQTFKVVAYVREEGKSHPVALILENGRCIDLDPWDIEALFELNYAKDEQWPC